MEILLDKPFLLSKKFSGVFDCYLQGISSLKADLFDVTLQQQYMGERIPAVWLTFESKIEEYVSFDETLYFILNI